MLKLKLLCASMLAFTFFNAQSQVTVDLYPNGAAFSTGSTTTSSKSDGNMAGIINGFSRGYAKFNLSTIPANVTVTSATVTFTTIGGSNGPASYIYGFTGDPAAIAAPTLYTSCGSGPILNSSVWLPNGANPSPLNASGIAFITSNLAKNNVSFGFVNNTFSTTNIYGYPNATAQQPRLTLTYTCPTVNIPYSENFNALTPPAIPACASIVDVNGGNTWISANAPTGYVGRVLQYPFSNSVAADDWFFTPGLNLTAGNTYLLSYKYGNNSTFSNEKLEVKYGASATVAGMTTTLATYPSINDNTPHIDAISITPTSTGVYYFGFHAYSAANQFNLYLDDINVSQSSVWTGATSTEWNLASNWLPATVPDDPATNVIIPSATNAPVIANGSTFAVKSLTIQGGGSLTINGVVQVNGYISNVGTLDASSGTIVMAGLTAVQLPTASFNSGKIKNLVISNSGGVTLTGSAQLYITGSLSFGNTSNTVLTTNGLITLQSDANGTAMLTDITNGGAVSGNSISGTVTVERYIPSLNRKKYTLITSPVSSPDMFSSWQENGEIVPGYGTQITGPTGTSSANGFDAVSTSGQSSVFTYNDNNATGSKWVGLTNTFNTNLGVSKGFLVFVRGDRTAGPTSSATSSTVLRANGTLSTGTYNFSGLITGANKYNLVANPYASPVDWLSTGVTKTRLTGSFTVYDPNLGVFVTSTGSVVSPSASTQQARYIQSGQAFFIQNSASTFAPGLTFTESSKASSAATSVANTVFGNDKNARLNINIYSAADNMFTDGAVALFGQSYKTDVDDEDAGKMSNLGETFALRRNSQPLSIEARPLVTSKDTLFFSMSAFGKKEYSMVIDGSNFTNTDASLEDRYTGAKQTIDLSGTTTYKFTVNGDAASSSDDRFIVTFGNANAVNTQDIAESNKLFVKLSPNPAKDRLKVSFKTANTDDAVITVINSLGQVVNKTTAGKVASGNVSINLKGLAAGNYTVQLLSGDKKVAVSSFIKE